MLVAKEIENRINELESCRKNLIGYAKKKAETISSFKKARAIVILKMQNNVPMVFEGLDVKNTPATTRKEIADGICWHELLETEQADALYKALVTNINSIESELNGCQSLYKNQLET